MLSNINLSWHVFNGLGYRADTWSSRRPLHPVNWYIIVGPAPFEAFGPVASCSRHCWVVGYRTLWVENGSLCCTSVQILVPVYQSTPRPIYILHPPNIQLPRSAEVPYSKLQWVCNFNSSTQSPGHTVKFNGSMTLIHPFQPHGPVVSTICQLSTTRLWQGCTDRSLWQGCTDRSLWQGCYDKVAMTRSLWQGRSDKVTLTRSLWQGRSDKVTLTRSLWQGRSDKVALTRSLWQGRSDKVALTRSLSQGRSDKVALTRLLWQGYSDKVALTRLLWQGHWQGRSDKVTLTRLLWQGHWQGRSDKVALTRSLWQGRSDKVTLTRSLWQDRSDKVALTRSLWQGRSDKVTLTRSLWQGRSDKVALTRSLWQGHSDKVTLTRSLTRSLWQGRSDRLFWQVALRSTSYSSNKHSANVEWPTLTTYSTIDPRTLAVMNRIWDQSGPQGPTKPFSAAFVGIWGPNY